MDEEIIAKNIKALRKQHEITLQKLADLTGLTKGYLSRIERSKKPPPYSTLNRIAIALGVEVGVLLGVNLQNNQDTRISFTKRNERRRVNKISPLLDGSLYAYEYAALALNKPGKNMEPYIMEVAFEEKAVFQHEGEEFLFVLEGTHEFSYGGEKYLMEPGDSVYFDSAVPHTGRSIGKKKAKVLGVMYNYKRF